MGKLVQRICILGALFLGWPLLGDPITSAFKTRSVSFVFVKNDRGELVANGTCFFVGVRNPANTNAYYYYVVTAKHVLQTTNGSFFSQVVLRVNDRKGGYGWVPLSLDATNGMKVFTHKDSTVDLAVVELALNDALADAPAFPAQFIVSRDVVQKLNVREGDDVFFPGLFIPFHGNSNNVPIYRFGRISTMTEEKIPWPKDGPISLYLIEAQSFGGYSGSPVFLQREASPPSENAGIWLLGVMKGTFLSANEVRVVDVKPVPFAVENAGIAAVIPASYLQEILFSEEVKETRIAGRPFRYISGPPIGVWPVWTQ